MIPRCSTYQSSKLNEIYKNPEPDHNHDNEELEKEQEKDTYETESITANQVF
jgi:hypothetical protein